MSKQRTRRFLTKILRKTCSLLVKLFLGERIILHKISTVSCKKQVLKINVFLHKITKCKSANMGSSTVQLHGVDLIDIQVQNLL